MISNELILLELINEGAGFTVLRKRGLTNSQIAILIQRSISNGFVEIIDNKTVITSKGIRYLKGKDCYKKYRRILPVKSDNTQPIHRGVIILPKRL